jgi:hypothetical protein
MYWVSAWVPLEQQKKSDRGKLADIDLGQVSREVFDCTLVDPPVAPPLQLNASSGLRGKQRDARVMVNQPNVEAPMLTQHDEVRTQLVLKTIRQFELHPPFGRVPVLQPPTEPCGEIRASHKALRRGTQNVTCNSVNRCHGV